MRLRSRIDWLSEGDASTTYFHAHAKYRKRKNYIAKLKVADFIVTSHEEMEDALLQYYTDLIGTAHHRMCSLNLEQLLATASSLNALDAPISEEEAWNVIKELPPDKAPGPDGFIGCFYKSCWVVIKHDVMREIGAVHAEDSRKLHLLNFAYIILIPKKEDAESNGDYRPISLVHGFAKLVTKIVAKRLAPHMNLLVSPNQSSVIRGRSIHDNFMLVHQMARHLSSEETRGSF